MFNFSFRQYLLLGIGFSLILFSISLSWIETLSEAVFDDDTVAWHQLTISPGKKVYVSSLDDSTLVLRSSSHSDARLTLFTREDDGASPGDLVKDYAAATVVVMSRSTMSDSMAQSPIMPPPHRCASC